MGLSTSGIQHLVELHNLGYLKEAKSVLDIGATELHIKKKDLKELIQSTGKNINLIDKFPNIDNWPKAPRTSSKHLYEFLLNTKEYSSLDLNGLHGAIKHDLNKPFVDKKLFNKYDLVTDFGCCEHVFNVSEAYTTLHNLTKNKGIIIIIQEVFGGNGYFTFDKSFLEGIAAANNYTVINGSYIIILREKTKDGSDLQYHIHLSKNLLNTIDLSKIKSIGISMIFQKTSDKEFLIPYQGSYMEKIYGVAGFNRFYLKDHIGYSYIKSSERELKEVSFFQLVKEFFRRLLKKFS